MAVGDDELLRQIAAADGDSDALRALFHELVDLVGSDDASATWWRAFSRYDASET